MNRLENILRHATAAMQALTPDDQDRVIGVSHGAAEVHIYGPPIAGEAVWTPHFATGNVTWSVMRAGIRFFGLGHNDGSAPSWGCPAEVIAQAEALEAAELAAQGGAS